MAKKSTQSKLKKKTNPAKNYVVTSENVIKISKKRKC